MRNERARGPSCRLSSSATAIATNIILPGSRTPSGCLDRRNGLFPLFDSGKVSVEAVNEKVRNV